MPWESKTVEEQRKDFIRIYNECENMSNACREFGISRRTGYKWLKRHKESETLCDKERLPKSIANKTAQAIEDEILAMRVLHPAWGGKKIYSKLLGKVDGLPSARTCSTILKRNNCIDPTETLKHKPYKRFEREHCNELWQTDFKGDFLMDDGNRCFALTIIDDCSRYSIKIRPKTNTLGVKDAFRDAFIEFGLPESVLSDNGWQFRGLHKSYTQYERWLMDHDVLPIHGRVMHPQTQGKIERFHRTLKTELLKRISFKDINHADELLQSWRKEYNEERPHEALGMKCPAEIYKQSSRQYNDKTSTYYYDGRTTKVNNWGYLRFGGLEVYLSETMANTYVEICETKEAKFEIHYRNFNIATVDAPTKQLINRCIFRL